MADIPMGAKPIETLELHYPIITVLISHVPYIYQQKDIQSWWLQEGDVELKKRPEIKPLYMS